MMNSKKRFILTHPLTGNYGGLLQAHALYTTINKLGFQAYIYRYQANDQPMGLKDYWRYFKRHIKYCLGKCDEPHTVWRRLEIARKFMKGIRFFNERNLACLPKEAAFVVGSDQVWRAIFCRTMKHPAYYFLDFVPEALRRRSIAYAASFGVDEWEGTPEETVDCTRLLQDFKAISVREQSGITICRDHMQTEAVAMPDPTMLLKKEEYEALIRKENTWAPIVKSLAAYVIDENGAIPQLLHSAAKELGVTLQHLLPHTGAAKRRDRFAPTVGQWLRLIRDCDYFITDSFHGTVFAIIFNKPFVCLGNKGRGSARFETLLGTYGLQGRLLTSATPEKIAELMHSPIDWESVNNIRNKEMQRGIQFLKTNL